MGFIYDRIMIADFADDAPAGHFRRASIFGIRLLELLLTIFRHACRVYPSSKSHCLFLLPLLPQLLNGQARPLNNGAPLDLVQLFLKVLQAVVLAGDEGDLARQDGRAHVDLLDHVVHHDAGARRLAGAPVGVGAVDGVRLWGLGQRGCRRTEKREGLRTPLYSPGRAGCRLMMGTLAAARASSSGGDRMSM